MSRSSLPSPPHADAVTPDPAESGSGRHRGVAFRHHPATLLTAVITVGALGLAAFSGVGGSTPTLDTSRLQASLSGTGPVVAEGALGSVKESAARQVTQYGSVRADMANDSRTALDLSRSATTRGVGFVAESSEQIAAEREAAEEAAAAQAAEEAAAAQAAEEAAAAQAAEEAAAAQAAEEAAAAQAAEEAAAAQAAEEAAAAQAAEEAAVAVHAAEERAAEEESASRSQARSEPVEEETYEEPVEEETSEEPVEEEAYEEPAEDDPAPVASGDPKSIARAMLGGYGWGDDQFGCLESLWTKESGWNTYAENPSSGAYGIPQSLPGSKMASAGSDWQSNPATQISWGLGYIDGRYGSPCSAWSHSQANNWY